jgi:hypothetical protein
MSGQDAPNDVFIEGDAERQSNLLSDPRATPRGIALLSGENRVNEFFGWTIGTGLNQDMVKVQKGRRLQNDGRTDQPGRPHK